MFPPCIPWPKGEEGQRYRGGGWVWNRKSVVSAGSAARMQFTTQGLLQGSSNNTEVSLHTETELLKHCCPFKDIILHEMRE